MQSIVSWQEGTSIEKILLQDPAVGTFLNQWFMVEDPVHCVAIPGFVVYKKTVQESYEEQTSKQHPSMTLASILPPGSCRVLVFVLISFDDKQ